MVARGVRRGVGAGSTMGLRSWQATGTRYRVCSAAQHQRAAPLATPVLCILSSDSHAGSLNAVCSLT